MRSGPNRTFDFGLQQQEYPFIDGFSKLPGGSEIASPDPRRQRKFSRAGIFLDRGQLGASTASAEKANRWICCALAALALVYLVLLGLFPLNASDIYFYLEIGRRFFSGEGVPRTDIFLFTSADAVLDCYHELGAMLAYYAAYAAGGFSALVLFKTALLLAIGVLPFWVAWKLNLQRPSWALSLLSVCAAYGASGRFIERGSLFSDLFATLLISLIILIRAQVGRVRLYRYCIPPLFLVWVNMHAGYVLGVVFLLLWFLSELTRCLARDQAERRLAASELRSIAAIIVASLILGLLNPRGPQSYVSLAKVLLGNHWSITMSSNFEFMSPLGKDFPKTPDIWFFFGVLIACALLLAASSWKPFMRRAYGELPFFEALCLSTLALFSMTMVRFIITASFGATVIAAALLARIRRSAMGSPVQPLLPALVLLGVAGCVWTVASHGYGPPDGRRTIGLGVDLSQKPTGACDFIDAVSLRANIFNKYEYGAYMIWRWRGRRRVYIHGFIANTNYLIQDYQWINRSPQDFDRIVRKYRIDAFLLPTMRLYHDSAPLPNYYLQLMTDRTWHLVFADDVAMLFLRDLPEHREIIENYSARRPH